MYLRGRGCLTEPKNIAYESQLPSDSNTQFGGSLFLLVKLIVFFCHFFFIFQVFFRRKIKYLPRNFPKKKIKNIFACSRAFYALYLWMNFVLLFSCCISQLYLMHLEFSSTKPALVVKCENIEVFCFYKTLSPSKCWSDYATEQHNYIPL